MSTFPDGPLNPTVRVGDAERQRTVDLLVQAHSLGQLNLEEFDQRSSQAWQAKTQADLVPLTADLPATQPATPKSAGRSRGRSSAWHGAPLGFLRFTMALAGVLLALAIVGWVIGHLFFLLPLVVLWMVAAGRFGGPGRGPRGYGGWDRRYSR